MGLPSPRCDASDRASSESSAPTCARSSRSSSPSLLVSDVQPLRQERRSADRGTASASTPCARSSPWRAPRAARAPPPTSAVPASRMAPASIWPLAVRRARTPDAQRGQREAFAVVARRRRASSASTSGSVTSRVRTTGCAARRRCDGSGSVTGSSAQPTCFIARLPARLFSTAGRCRALPRGLPQPFADPAVPLERPRYGTGEQVRLARRGRRSGGPGSSPCRGARASGAACRPRAGRARRGRTRSPAPCARSSRTPAQLRQRVERERDEAVAPRERRRRARRRRAPSRVDPHDEPLVAVEEPPLVVVALEDHWRPRRELHSAPPARTRATAEPREQPVVERLGARREAPHARGAEQRAPARGARRARAARPGPRRRTRRRACGTRAPRAARSPRAAATRDVHQRSSIASATRGPRRGEVLDPLERELVDRSPRGHRRREPTVDRTRVDRRRGLDDALPARVARDAQVRRQPRGPEAGAQVAEDRPRLDRRQLVGVAEEDEPRVLAAAREAAGPSPPGRSSTPRRR